jgi:hypothetical protein
MMEMLERALAEKIAVLWQEVSWATPREKADRLRNKAIQSCHALHRAANPAYRERCAREQISERLELAQLPAVVFPEEIYKAYGEKTRPDGRSLGPFCEQDVPLLLEHLNHYLVHPITMEGLAENYMPFTNIRGGLDRLRADLLSAQGVSLVTSSGTTGSAFSLIPLDKTSFEMLLRANGRTLDEASRVPGYGSVDPDKHCIVGHFPRKGSMALALAFEFQARRFGERAFMAIPTNVQTRELRWRAGGYAGLSGQVLKLIMKPFLTAGGRQIARKGWENLLAGLQKAEELGLRTAVVGNAWMAYKALKRMESLLQAEIERGRRQPGDPLIKLAPGSVLIFGGGNKSGLNVPEEEIIALFHKLVGGLDRVSDIYSQAEGFGTAIRCQEGNYHVDPHVEYFVLDSYLAHFDPRQTNRVPAIVSGDVVDAICEVPCPCGAPTRYFRRVQRDDQNRGSKGCAAALAEYA